jgi:hypothetical protein
MPAGCAFAISLSPVLQVALSSADVTTERACLSAKPSVTVLRTASAAPAASAHGTAETPSSAGLTRLSDLDQEAYVTKHSARRDSFHSMPLAASDTPNMSVDREESPDVQVWCAEYEVTLLDGCNYIAICTTRLSRAIHIHMFGFWSGW